MTKLLFQAVCTVAILSAAPAFAQSNNPTERPRFPSADQPSGRASPPGAYSPSNSPAGAMNQGSPAPSSGNTAMSPGQSTDATGSTTQNSHDRMHRSSKGMSPHRAMHANRGRTAGDEAVERLNAQSLRAAQQGQAMGASTGSMGGGSGSMNDMSGGSMNGGGMTPPSGNAGNAGGMGSNPNK